MSLDPVMWRSMVLDAVTDSLIFDDVVYVDHRSMICFDDSGMFCIHWL